jgi:pilus assembly protein CpaB
MRAANELPPGTLLSSAEVRDPAAQSAGGAPVRPGERVADVVGRGSPELVVAGARVDVLVTRDARGSGAGRTELALQDVEVLSAAGASSGDGSPGADDPAAGTPRVAVSLRVTLRQAIFLAAAQNFAREIRLLPRGPGDRGRASGGLTQVG